MRNKQVLGDEPALPGSVIGGPLPRCLAVPSRPVRCSDLSWNAVGRSAEGHRQPAGAPQCSCTGGGVQACHAAQGLHRSWTSWSCLCMWSEVIAHMFSVSKLSFQHRRAGHCSAGPEEAEAGHPGDPQGCSGSRWSCAAHAAGGSQEGDSRSFTGDAWALSPVSPQMDGPGRSDWPRSFCWQCGPTLGLELPCCSLTGRALAQSRHHLSTQMTGLLGLVEH